jgi:putative transposase
MEENLPRQPRLDAPGTLHHLMGRGIEASKLFRTKKDREDFIDRLAELCRSGRWSLYAWALIPHHFHLLVRTGKESLARRLRRLMTGCAIHFNLLFFEATCPLTSKNSPPILRPIESNVLSMMRG